MSDASRRQSFNGERAVQLFAKLIKEGKEYHAVKGFLRPDDLVDLAVKDEAALVVLQAILNALGGAAGGKNLADLVTVPPTGTDDVASYTAGGTVGYNIRGYTATGTQRAMFWLEVDGVEKYHQRIVSSERNVNVIIPAGDLIAPSKIVKLRVLNEGSTSGNYNGTIMGDEL